jgi:predicted transposase YbfD/YdcC
MVCLVYLCRIAQARTSHARLLIAANSVQKPFNQSISVTLKKSNSFHLASRAHMNEENRHGRSSSVWQVYAEGAGSF